MFEKSRCVVGGILKMIYCFHNERHKLPLNQGASKLPFLWITKLQVYFLKPDLSQIKLFEKQFKRFLYLRVKT